MRRKNCKSNPPIGSRISDMLRELTEVAIDTTQHTYKHHDLDKQFRKVFYLVGR